MSDNKTPKKKPANKSQSSSSSADEITSPLAHNSFDLAEHESRSSNLQHGAIGGPTVPVRPARALPIRPAPTQPFRHTTSLAHLSVIATGNQRQLRSNQPGASYVLDLPTWRRGPGEEAPRPAAIGDEVRGQPRPGDQGVPRVDSDENGVARENKRPVEYYEKEVVKYQHQHQQQYQQQQQKSQQQKSQQLLHGLSQDFGALDLGGQRGIEGGSRGFDGRAHDYDETRELFRPMNAKINPEAANLPLTEEEKMIRDFKGISHNYQGDSSNPANESADIPEDQNCSVWLTNLPPDCTYRDLLQAIAVHHPGKVFATYISPPSGQGPYHLPSRGHSAAKVVFYYPWSAQYLINKANNTGLWVRGYPARAVPNRIRAAPQSYENNTTRCLTIEGPADVVNYATLRQLWDGYFSWDTEEVRNIGEWVDNNGVKIRRIEWRFGSHRAQAVAAFQYIRDHLPHIWRFYTADPCDVLVQLPHP